MNKKIYFITQAKGGAGKSVLAFMLAEKYKRVRVIPPRITFSEVSIGNLLTHIY